MSVSDEKEKTKLQKQIDAEIAATQANPEPSTPRNLDPPKPAGKRQPTAGVKEFRVRTRGLPNFRRCGLMFSPDPVEVDAAALSDAQKVELLNTQTLNVEEIMPSAKVSDAKASDTKK